MKLSLAFTNSPNHRAYCDNSSNFYIIKLNTENPVYYERWHEYNICTHNKNIEECKEAAKAILEDMHDTALYSEDYHNKHYNNINIALHPYFTFKNAETEGIYRIKIVYPYDD